MSARFAKRTFTKGIALPDLDLGQEAGHPDQLDLPGEAPGSEARASEASTEASTEEAAAGAGSRSDGAGRGGSSRDGGDLEAYASENIAYGGDDRESGTGSDASGGSSRGLAAAAPMSGAHGDGGGGRVGGAAVASAESGVLRRRRRAERTGGTEAAGGVPAAGGGRLMQQLRTALRAALAGGFRDVRLEQRCTAYRARTANARDPWVAAANALLALVLVAVVMAGSASDGGCGGGFGGAGVPGLTTTVLLSGVGGGGGVDVNTNATEIDRSVAAAGGGADGSCGGGPSSPWPLVELMLLSASSLVLPALVFRVWGGACNTIRRRDPCIRFCQMACLLLLYLKLAWAARVHVGIAPPPALAAYGRALASQVAVVQPASYAVHVNTSGLSWLVSALLLALIFHDGTGGRVGVGGTGGTGGGGWALWLTAVATAALLVLASAALAAVVDCFCRLSYIRSRPRRWAQLRAAGPRA